jgi:hypothetical protein
MSRAPRTSFVARGCPEASQGGVGRASVGARGALEQSVKCAPSNMRLKLPGAVVLKESECLCASAHELSFYYAAPCGRVARSLSAIR